MNSLIDLPPIASDLDYWIDSSSTYVDDDNDNDNDKDNDASKGPFSSKSSSARSSKRKLPTRQDGEQVSDLFFELGVRDSVCKHAPLSLTYRGVLVLPRAFQHHRIQKWLKKQILDQGFDLKKNFQCPPSRCVGLVDDLSSPLENDLNWITYRYLRLSSQGAKQVMCRFCHGRNWVSTSNFFKHLFLAHGIMTQVKPNLLADLKVEVFSITDYFTVKVQTIQSLGFTRNILPLLDVSLVPIPEKKFSKILNNGFRRTHVMCPHCFKWIRLGWCEYDEIIRQDHEDFDSFRNFNLENYAEISYVQKRDRNSIEGLYENYFIHYIECDFTRFESRCLYVRID